MKKIISTVLLLAAMAGGQALNAQVLAKKSFAESFSPPQGMDGPVYRVSYDVVVSKTEQGMGIFVAISPQSITVSAYRYKGKDYTAAQIGASRFTLSDARGGYSFRVKVSYNGKEVGDSRINGIGPISGGRYSVDCTKLGLPNPVWGTDTYMKEANAISRTISSSEPKYSAGLMGYTNASYQKAIKEYLDK